MERIKKEIKERVMNVVNKVNDAENYETSWNEKGLPESKNKINIKRGSLSRAQGARFELKVREALETQKWIIDKWTNNVNLEENKIVKVKPKFNPFTKTMVMNSGGFPDFIAFKKTSGNDYKIIGVEVKMNGILSKIEKEKCKWYLKNKIFSEILIAKKGEKRGEIEYTNFEEKYGIK